MIHPDSIKDMFTSARVYRLYSGVKQYKLTYRYATLKKPRQEVINDLLDKFNHCRFYITENDVEIFRYKPPVEVKEEREFLPGSYSNKSFNS